MERDPAANPPPEPIEPDDALPDADAEDLPREPGTLPDTGRVIEDKGRTSEAEEKRGGEDGSEG